LDRGKPRAWGACGGFVIWNQPEARFEADFRSNF